MEVFKCQYSGPISEDYECYSKSIYLPLQSIAYLDYDQCKLYLLDGTSFNITHSSREVLARSLEAI